MLGIPRGADPAASRHHVGRRACSRPTCATTTCAPSSCVEGADRRRPRSTASFDELAPSCAGAPGARWRGARTEVRVERSWTAATSARATSCASRSATRASPRPSSRGSTRVHEAEYGRAYGDPIEVVNLRVTVTGRRPRLDAYRVGSRRRLVRGRSARRRRVWRVDGELAELPTRQLLRERAAARRAGRRARDHLPARHHHRRAAGVGGHRHRRRAADAHRPARGTDDVPLIVTRRARRPDHRDGDRRRPQVDRDRDGLPPGAHVVLVDHPRVRGLRLRDLRRPGPAAVRVRRSPRRCSPGPIPGYVRGHQPAASPSWATSGSPATWWCTTTPTTARPTSPTSASACPSSSATSSSASRSRPRTTSTSARSARAAAGSSTPPTPTPRGCVQRDQVEEDGAEGERLADHRRQHARPAPGGRRHGGAGRGRQARRRALRRARRAVRPGGGPGGSEHIMDHSERMLRSPDREAARRPLRGRGDHRRLPRPPGSGLQRTSDQGRRHDLAARTCTSTSPGTSPQVDLPINMPFVGTVDVAVCLTLRSLLLDTDATTPCPTNSGLFRPITIAAPPGTLANPASRRRRSRASVGQHRRRHGDARARAGLPERVGAGVGNLKVVAFSGRDGRLGLHGHHRRQLRRSPRQGRARRGRHPVREHAQQPDRGHRVPLSAAGDAATSCARTGPAPGAGAAASARSASSSSWRTAASPSRATATRSRRPACSAAAPGRPGEVVMNPGTPDEEQLPSKIPYRACAAGTMLRLAGPCGGGYGDRRRSATPPRSPAMPRTASPPRTNEPERGERTLASDLVDAGRIGASGEGGVARFALTPELAQITAWVAEDLERLGMETDSDEAGNFFGKWQAGSGKPSHGRVPPRQRAERRQLRRRAGRARGGRGGAPATSRGVRARAADLGRLVHGRGGRALRQRPVRQPGVRRAKT